MRIRRHRRRPWLRVLWRGSLGTLALTLVAMVAGVVYLASVPLPKDPFQPQQSILYYSDGHTVLARVGVVDRTAVPLRQVPLAVRYAVLAAEDRTYYQHGAVSARGILRSIWADVNGSQQGASTITQQYARNAYLTPDRTVSRKTREIALAVKLQNRYSKDEILERYLNTIYFGRGAYGIDAAARAYFGVSVSKLTAAQGMVLAAVIKDPTNFDPAVDPAAAKQRFRYVLSGMRAEHWISDTPKYPTVRAPGGDSGLSGPTGLIVERVEQELAAHGITAQQLRTRGLRVVTTIDRTAQTEAESDVTRKLAHQPKELRAALVAVEPSTGAVRAYYGNTAGYGYYDDAAAPRAPKEAFLPLFLAAALAAGVSPDSTWDGSSPQTFPDYGKMYNPADAQCGQCSLWQAVAEGLPTVLYRVAEKVGPARIAGILRSAGVSAKYGGSASMVNPSGGKAAGRTTGAIALGDYPVSPADLASAYATLGNHGTAQQRHFVTRVRTATGDTLYSTRSAPRTVLDGKSVDTTLGLVGGAPLLVVQPSSNAAANRKAFIAGVLLGRSGTEPWGADGQAHSAWMAGTTSKLAVSAWIGREDAGPIRTANGKAITGDGMPATLVYDLLRALPDAGSMQPDRTDAPPSARATR